MPIETEYVAAIAVVVVAILKLFKINIGTEVISNLILAVLGLWVAIKRHGQGDITLAGTRK